MTFVHVRTRRGIDATVRMWDGAGTEAPAVVYLHGTSGLLADEPLLDALSARYRVYAPVWPGYGDEPGEELLEDMLDFALHGWDLIDALERDAGFRTPHLVGHSMGGMIAAEMACLAPGALGRLVLIDPLGVWLDEAPIPDIFATLPYQFPGLLFHDAERGAALLTGGLDFSDPKAVEAFMVANSRRLGTAGKILFPIPARRVTKRLYRVTNPTLLLWGEHDALVPAAPYGAAWRGLLPEADYAEIPGAAHMLPVEQPAAAAAVLLRFLG